MSSARTLVAILAMSAAASLGCQSAGSSAWSRWTRGSTQPASDVADKNGADHPDPAQQKITLLQAQATLSEADGNRQGAIQIYEKILQTDPQHSLALQRLAVLSVQQGDYSRAEECFQAALRLTSDSAQLHNDYGYFCHLQKKADAALHHLRRAVTLDPKLREAHNNLGLVCAATGRHEEACLHFRLAGCSRAEMLNNLAFARLMERDFEGAAASYQEALHDDPNLQVARTALRSLNQASKACWTGAPNHAQQAQQAIYHGPQAAPAQGGTEQAQWLDARRMARTYD